MDATARRGGRRQHLTIGLGLLLAIAVAGFCWLLFDRFFGTHFDCRERAGLDGKWSCDCKENTAGRWRWQDKKNECTRSYDCCLYQYSGITFIAHAPGYEGPKHCECREVDRPGRCGEALDGYLAAEVTTCPPRK